MAGEPRSLDPVAGLTIKGAVAFRSSLTDPPGAVGEKEILSLNPQRREQILVLTGWTFLEPGSLNLKVGSGAVDSLKNLPPAWIEDGLTVRYPPQYAHVPRMRRAYWYYFGTARRSGRSQVVLVRRAEVPLPDTIELFAPVRLTDLFGVVAKDEIEVDVHAN